jgi:hypothetical protein
MWTTVLDSERIVCDPIVWEPAGWILPIRVPQFFRENRRDLLTRFDLPGSFYGLIGLGCNIWLGVGLNFFLLSLILIGPLKMLTHWKLPNLFCPISNLPSSLSDPLENSGSQGVNTEVKCDRNLDDDIKKKIIDLKSAVEPQVEGDWGYYSSHCKILQCTLRFLFHFFHFYLSHWDLKSKIFFLSQ